MSNIALPYTQIIDPASFKSILNAKIYIGEYGTLPNPANSATWKQAYFVQDDGTRVAASQPIRTNAAGFAVDGSSNIRTVQVDGQYSLLVQDSLSVQKFSNTRVNEFSTSDPLSVDAITAVNATGLPDGIVIIAKGRSSVGDGGGGIFRYSSSSVQAADGGTVFAPATGSGRLFRDGWTTLGFNGPLNVQWFDGADFGAKVTNAQAALPSSGGILDARGMAGAQSISASLALDKPIILLLGAATISLGVNQLLIRASGVAIIGIGKIDENNSPTRFTYSGISDAILLKRTTAATPLFAPRLEDFEISATGSAATSSSALAISSYGTRYGVYKNIEVFNFQQGTAFYFTGNGAVVDGFGATNQIFNPAVSTCRIGIKADAAGGSQSTHGMIYGGFIFGTLSAFDSSCESWRFHDTDLGGVPSVKLRGSSDDTVLTACRWEASSSEVVIDASVLRTQIISPSFINHQGGGPEVTDNGSGTIIITTSGNTDSKLRALRAQVNYANKGTTASLVAGAGADVLDMSGGGTWLVGVRQSDGGSAWRAAGIVWSNGSSLAVSQFGGGANVTITSTGAQLRLVNAHATDAQALGWSVMKFEGSAQF